MIYLTVLSVVAIAALVNMLRVEARRYEALQEASAAERATLLNRIQAPERAVYESIPVEDDGPVHVPADDTPYADSMWDELVNG